MDINISNAVLCPWYNSIPNFPIISKPYIVGHFSINGVDRKYVSTSENLKYLKLPRGKKILLDLNKGYKDVIHKPESAADEKIDIILQFILDSKLKLLTVDGKPLVTLNYDFICYRGLLRLVMCTPYEYQDDWCILVTKFRGNIYLCQKETDQARNNRLRLDANERMKRFCSYGFKFEQYLLTDDPEQEPETDTPVNESEEFCCMFKTKLEGLRLLYGAEMDGIVSDKICDFNSMDPNDVEFVELKVTGKHEHPKQKSNYFKYKTRNWWCQSFLVGIQNLYVGFRDDRGLVDEISEIKVKSLPEKSSGHWHPNVCMDFLVRFLKTVQDIVKNVNCPYTVYKFYWHPKERKSISFRQYTGSNEYTFLPDWYIDKLKK